MRFLLSLLLSLLLSSAGLSQTKPVLKLTAELNFAGSQVDRITAYKFLENETKLLLVGDKIIKIVDVVNGTILETRPLDIPQFGEDNPRVISPDGRKMLVFGNYGVDNKKNKIKRPASIWDLQTGKQIAVLDQTLKPVRAGFWSKNGKILATSSDKYAPRFVDSTSVEVAFWDGETFKLQNSLPADKINWWYLTDDGSKCFFSVAPITNWFFIMKFIGERGGPINVWDVSKGQTEKTISVSEKDLLTNTRSISVSPNGKFLTYIAERPKAKDLERRLVVWEIEQSAFQLKAKHEITPNPKLPEYGITYSPDGKYLAFDAGKTLQIYETKTGAKKFELQKDDTPTNWLNDNRILLYNYGSKMEARDVATGNLLYGQPLIYYAYDFTDSNDISYSEVVDQTTIVVHPNRDIFLTYSNQYVKVLDSRTGELLQTLVQPAIDTTKPVHPKKGPRLSSKSLVSTADWAHNGKILYVIGADKEKVSLWQLEN